MLITLNPQKFDDHIKASRKNSMPKPVTTVRPKSKSKTRKASKSKKTTAVSKKRNDSKTKNEVTALNLGRLRYTG